MRGAALSGETAVLLGQLVGCILYRGSPLAAASAPRASLVPGDEFGSPLAAAMHPACTQCVPHAPNAFRMYRMRPACTECIAHVPLASRMYRMHPACTECTPHVPNASRRGTEITHFQTPKFGKLKKVAPGVAHILWEDSLGKNHSGRIFLLRRRELDKSISKYF